MNDTQRVLDAMLAISSDLELEAVLRRIVAAACAIADAEYGALGVLSDAGAANQMHLTDFITHGVDENRVRRIGHPPRGDGILGVLIREPAPLRLHNLTAHPQSVGFPEDHPAMRTFLGVPIRIRGVVFGNLYLAEKRGGGDFTPEDENLVVALAGAAGVAIENARLHQRVRELAVVAERERIARDLHDTVIQRLFATGLSLQALSRRVGETDTADRIQIAVEELDATIRDIRGVIFALHAHERGAPGLPVLVLAIAGDMAQSLGFEPRVHLDGHLDGAISAALTTYVLEALRQLLGNVARHAQATSVDIRVRADADIELTVVDNGIGPGTKRKGGSLRDLRRQARSLGGEFTLRPGADRGSVATWRVPRGDQRDD